MCFIWSYSNWPQTYRCIILSKNAMLCAQFCTWLIDSELYCKCNYLKQCWNLMDLSLRISLTLVVSLITGRKTSTISFDCLLSHSHGYIFSCILLVFVKDFFKTFQWLHLDKNLAIVIYSLSFFFLRISLFLFLGHGCNRSLSLSLSFYLSFSLSFSLSVSLSRFLFLSVSLSHLSQQMIKPVTPFLVSVPEEGSTSKYKLYVYGEGRYAASLGMGHFHGIPVLFIPGNAGCFKQVGAWYAVTVTVSCTVTLSLLKSQCLLYSHSVCILYCHTVSFKVIMSVIQSQCLYLVLSHCLF